MHPEILRELIAERNRDLQAQAHQAMLARAAAKAARAGRRGHRVPDQVVIPAIPDYVDGSFGTEPAAGAAASEPGQAPAARHAA